MFEKWTRYQLIDGDEFKEKSLRPSNTAVAQSTYFRVLVVLFLASIFINIGFTIDRVTYSTIQIRPTSTYGEMLHHSKIKNLVDAV